FLFEYFFCNVKYLFFVFSKGSVTSLLLKKLKKTKQNSTYHMSEQIQDVAATNFELAQVKWETLQKIQCALHKHEFLICGSLERRACYSFHTLKNEFKFVCEYPSNVELRGHCVVKLVDNNKDSNEITLLSFGGSKYITRHTLTMKYVS
ncbi:hypothetical protein RFI_35088, partial [Reticulomyxa filosa]